MLEWEKRPIEIANLFNPAFGAIILRESIKAYQHESFVGMPYPLVFLILPLVLHKPSRQALPKTTATKLHGWILTTPQVGINLAERIRHLVPYTRETILFGMQMGIFNLDESGNFVLLKKRFAKPSWHKGTEPDLCRAKAEFLGRWLFKAGDISTIFIMLGVQP
jgi:hypothetical protein